MIATRGVLVVIVSALFVCAFCGGCDSRDGAAEERAIFALFERARAPGSKGEQERRLAAEELVRLRGGEIWAVLILTKPDVLGDYCPPGMPDDMKESRLVGRRAVVVAILENMPESAGTALLLAATECLSDHGIAKWGETRGVFPIKKQSEHERPVRDAAREALIRVLSLDCGFDASAWEEVILKKAGGQ